jgi:hypothetical protein
MRKGLTKLLAVAATLGLVACGGGGASDIGGGSSNGALSNIGTTPSYVADHDGYMTGAHANYECGTSCHAIPLTNRTADGMEPSAMATSDRTRICVTCHQSQYDATSALNHSQNGIGVYCNSCHYSDTFTSRNRAATSSYHPYITTSCATCHSGRQPSSHGADRQAGCESCHRYPSWSATTASHTATTNCVSCHNGRQPSSHGADRQAGCESCHSYPSWSATTAFSHTGVTSGCNVSGCHTRHYSGYDCVWCHTGASAGNSFGGWSHNRTDDRACTACHSDGKGDDGKDDDDDGKDDDGKGDDDDDRTVGWLF